MTTATTEGQQTLSAAVAEEIRAMMARRRMSGRELAAKLDVSPAWVSYRLVGKQPIDLNDLARIAEVLSVKVVNLLPAAARGDSVYYATPADRPRDNRPAGGPGRGPSGRDRSDTLRRPERTRGPAPMARSRPRA